MRISDWSSDVCSSDLFFQASQPTQTKKTTVMTTKMMKAMSSGVDMALASPVQRQQRAEHVEGQFAQQEREIQQSDRHDDARDHHLLLPSNQGASNQGARNRSEEHTSELQSLMRISYAVFC